MLKATALALREHPRLNSSYLEGELVEHATVDLGVAVAVGDDLVVPTIAAVDSLPLSAIAARSRELVARSRSLALTLADLAPGSFTVTNLGMLGATRFVPLLNPPQVAILSVGVLRADAARPRPDGFEPVMTLGVVCDHHRVRLARGGLSACRPRAPRRAAPAPPTTSRRETQR